MNLGRQPAQRCAACTAARKRPSRWWPDRGRLDACPNCGGELLDTVERRQGWGSGAETKAETKRARIDALHDLGQGSYVVRRKITVAEWGQEWLAAQAIGSLRATSKASQRSNLVKHLLPKLGNIKLQALSRERILAHYAWLASQGRGGTQGRPLSNNTLRHIHATLHCLLRDAVRANLLARNPASDIALPRVGIEARDARLNAWNATELAAFLAATKDDRLNALWHTLAMTGMRRGEALALRWDDLDLERGAVSINKSRVALDRRVIESATKTGRARVVQIDPETVAVLRAHAQAQLEELADNPEALEQRFVFTSAAGAPLMPCTVSHRFTSEVRRAALPYLSLHGLRHTHATLLLLAGVPAKIVQERLGHSSITVTMDIYSHVLPGMDADAAVVFGRLVAAASTGATS